jgi:PemK-like, MazF-like toxin of type II toxin-antitoxin system
MGAPSAGDVVLVRFPFSDLSATKVRPAVVLAAAGRDDFVLCQITSNSYSDPLAIALSNADFATGGLLAASFARPGKLFTANSSLIFRQVGQLQHAAFTRLLDGVITLLNPDQRN